MTAFASPNAVHLNDAVERCAAELLIEVGPRQLRSAHIAKRAGIPESTLFRKYKNIDEILAATYEWSWAMVNRAVVQGSFAEPLADPLQTLLRDAHSLFSMRNDPASATALHTAFFLMRRRTVFNIDEECEAQRTFETRLRSLCRSVLTARGVEESKATDVIPTLILNYIATVCLTWLMLPVESDDVTAKEHDLTVEEAQMGVLVLLDKKYATGLGAQRIDIDA